jgi:hypothetical protein
VGESASVPGGAQAGTLVALLDRGGGAVYQSR